MLKKDMYIKSVVVILFRCPSSQILLFWMSCDNFLLLLSVVGNIIGVTDKYDDDLLKQSAQWRLEPSRSVQHIDW